MSNCCHVKEIVQEIVPCPAAGFWQEMLEFPEENLYKEMYMTGGKSSSSTVPFLV